MPTIEAPLPAAQSGVKVAAKQLTTIVVRTTSIEVLIGGPYKGRDGEMHTYGHAALRVVGPNDERVYDFGRYGDVTGDFGAEGEGILRVWTSFSSYIASENSYGRTTAGFTYNIGADKAQAINAYYDQLIAGAAPRRSKHPNMKEYKLARNYHGLSNNCTTLTLAGARIALPDIDADAAKHNIGRGLSSVEKMAARAKNFGSWPRQIFMPADTKAMLEAAKPLKADQTKTYGPSTK